VHPGADAAAGAEVEVVPRVWVRVGGIRARSERETEVSIRDEGVRVVVARRVEVQGVLVDADDSVGGDVEAFVGDVGCGVVGCAYALSG